MLAALVLAATVQSAFPTDDAIRSILVARAGATPSHGIVVGLVEPAGRRVVAHGPVDADSIFEIGSITKVFTATLLADAVARGEVALTDPVAKYLPSSVKVPQRGGRKITLQDLATHTSGLPGLPANLAPKDPANPYADYTTAQLYEFLSSYELDRDIGSQFEYSNLGFGLLGHVLASRARMTYEDLVRKRITDPLGMKDTFVTVPESAKTRFVKGYDAAGNPAPNWDLPSLAGAGSLRSTANDLLTFLAANLGFIDSPLPPLEKMLAVRRPSDMGEVGLAWLIVKTPGGHEMLAHGGGTGGYRSFMAMDRKRRVGVVVLTNVANPAGIGDIGRHLLDPGFELPQTKPTATVGADALERYTGRYELAPGVNLDVTREGERLFAQLTGQEKFEIFPEKANKFFYKVVAAQITFGDDSLVLHQNGRDMPARRVSREIPAPKVRNEIKIAPEVLERLVGRYQLAPNFIINVTREGDRLFVQATAQPRLEVFAESEREFFLKAVDAQITFEDGALILHQGGRDQRAVRMKN